VKNQLQIRNLVRTFNKHILNRLTRRIAYSSRGPFAIIRHVGRRSGKHYETPIIVQPVEGGFVIALTYGPDVDWLHNVEAAGRCEIVLHRKTYVIEKIEPMDMQAAMPGFPVFEGLILRRLGVRHFISLKAQDSGQQAIQS
jgi:deazaflavin-dependent oxidoreductase (nitroreductase family)